MNNLSTIIDRLKSVMADNPKSAQFARLADCLLQTGQTDEAIRICGYGLDHHPHYANAHFVLGRCHFEAGDLDAAESAFNKVLLYDSQHINAHHYQARIMKQREWQNAYVLWIKRALTIDPLEKTGQMMMSELEDVRTVEDIEGIAGLGAAEEGFTYEEEELKSVEETFAQESQSDEAGAVGSNAVSEAGAEPSADEALLEDTQTASEIEEETAGENMETATPEEQAGESAAVAEGSIDAGDAGDVSEEEQEEKRYEFILDDIFKDETEAEDLMEEAGEEDEGVVEEPYEEEEESLLTTEMEAESEHLEQSEEAGEADESGTEVPPPETTVSVEDKERIADEVFGEDEAVLEEEVDEDELGALEGEDELGDELEDEPDDELDDLTDYESETEIIEDVIEEEKPKADAEAPDSGQFIDFTAAERSSEDTSGTAAAESDADTVPETPEAAEPGLEFPDEVPEQAAETELEPDTTEPFPGEAESAREPEPEKSSAAAGKKDPIVTATLGEIYAAQGHYGKAIGVYEILLKKDPDNQHYKTKIETLRTKMEEEDRD